MEEVNLFKKILIAFFLIVMFNFLEYGFVWDRWDKIVYPLILTGITLFVLYISKLRKILLVISFILLLIMIFLYLVNELNLADMFGSFGFALLLITLSIYLPEIIRKGFIEKF